MLEVSTEHIVYREPPTAYSQNMQCNFIRLYDPNTFQVLIAKFTYEDV